MKFLTKKKKNADKEIAAGRDDEKQEVQNQTEDDMDEESLANGRDNVIEVKRTMGKKGKMLLAIAAIVVVLGLVTALLRYIRKYKHLTKSAAFLVVKPSDITP